jgi:hypothetical protein
VIRKLFAGHEHNFALHDLSESQNWGDVTYDFGSIMHYRLNSFSWNGEHTIEPKPGVDVDLGIVGQREGFSDSDLAQLNALYCSGRA